MIYLINEQVLNGTVTISINSMGVEANNFQEAVKKLKNSETFKNGICKIMYENDEEITYSVPQEENEKGFRYSVYGTMKNKQIKLI